MRDETQVGQPNLSRRAFLSAAGSSAAVAAIVGCSPASRITDSLFTPADVPPIDVHFLDFPDKEINALGARGIGEIGLAGIAAAITDAVHHATGVRVRELPVKIEHLLG